MTEKNRIIIFDTTMRDGEQSPGASMSLEEKLQISRVFDELGVDVIEAGFPIASPGDFEAVTEISKTLKRSIPAGLARATKKDIDACHQALKHAKNFRIHTFISTSPLHMKHKLNKTPEEVIDAIGDIVVVLTNLAHLRGVHIETCIAEAYSVIVNRKGKMINGTFVKDE